MTGRPPAVVFHLPTDAGKAWAKDYTRRAEEVRVARVKWLDDFHDRNGGHLPGERQFWISGERITGVDWPDGDAAPEGWRRENGSSKLVPDLRRKAGKALHVLLDAMTYPDARGELSRQFGMRSLVMVPMTGRYYTPGLRIEDGGVWATWGSTDVLIELGDVATHGWERIGLATYIEQFGEDDL